MRHYAIILFSWSVYRDAGVGAMYNHRPPSAVHRESSSSFSHKIAGNSPPPPPFRVLYQEGGQDDPYAVFFADTSTFQVRLCSPAAFPRVALLAFAAVGTLPSRLAPLFAPLFAVAGGSPEPAAGNLAFASLLRACG